MRMMMMMDNVDSGDTLWRRWWIIYWLIGWFIYQYQWWPWSDSSSYQFYGDSNIWIAWWWPSWWKMWSAMSTRAAMLQHTHAHVPSPPQGPPLYI
jgi:hypothetical protein